MINNRKTLRLKSWDYSSNGKYFVTICVNDRHEYFGNIDNNKVTLTIAGQIARDQWLWLSKHYPYIILDEFIIMPDHIHGILEIAGNDHPVGNGRDRSLQKIKPLSELIGAYKTTSSKLIRRNGTVSFIWQKSYHEEIIRSDASLQRIRSYIIRNPLLPHNRRL